MAQAMLRLLAKPKITAFFCGSVTVSSRRRTAARCDNFCGFRRQLGCAKAHPYNFCGAASGSMRQRIVRAIAFYLEMAANFLKAVEGFLDFFYGVAEDYWAAVGAAHGAIGFGEGAEEPFHFCLVQGHVYFYGGVAGGGGGDFGLQGFDGDGGVFAFDPVENFGE